MKFKVFFMLALCITLVAGCCACAANDVETMTQSTKNPVPAATTAMDPYSGSIINSNKESALSDATSAVTLLMTSLAEEGTPVIDDGTIFAVEKNGKSFYFKYVAGELEEVEFPSATYEITPNVDGWLQNVKVYAP